RTLYFIGDPAMTMLDVYVTQRAARGLPFDAPTLDAGLSSSMANDSRVAMTDDGLLAVISTARAPTAGAYDVSQLSRRTPPAAFGSASPALLANLNTVDPEYDPVLSGDGLRLYYATGINQVIRYATRTARSAAFGPSVPVTGLLAAPSADMSLSPDERVIAY